MNSSVKSFVPNVSDFPDELRLVADVLGAAGRDELELEPLLLPHAASSIAASRASAPATRIRGSRLDTGLGDGPRIVVFSSMGNDDRRFPPRSVPLLIGKIRRGHEWRATRVMRLPPGWVPGGIGILVGPGEHGGVALVGVGDDRLGVVKVATFAGGDASR